MMIFTSGKRIATDQVARKGAFDRCLTYESCAGMKQDRQSVIAGISPERVKPPVIGWKPAYIGISLIPESPNSVWPDRNSFSQPP